MEAQWLLLGLALALFVLTVSAFVRTGGILRGNTAWFACSWFAGEFAPWLAGLALVLLTSALGSGAATGERGPLTAMLLAASIGGLFAVHLRSRRSRQVLDSTLRDELGRSLAEATSPRRDADESKLETPIRSSRATATSLLPISRRPRSVERVPDLPYPGGHARNRLDVYRPASECRGAPVIMHIHGGNWSGGDKRRQALPLLHYLASVGWIVVAPEYRLSPEARLPAHLVDCKSAFAWIRSHIAALGGDPSFIAVAGGGAGAHLATLLALTFDEPELQPGFEHVDTRPSACIALGGIYDIADRRRHYLDHRSRVRWLGANVLPAPLAKDPDAWDEASPVTLVRPDAPPFLILHGAHDSLCHPADAREFAGQLRSVSDNPVVYVELPGAQHAWESAQSVRTEHTARSIARFLEWCRARQHCASGPRGSKAASGRLR